MIDVTNSVITMLGCVRDSGFGSFYPLRGIRGTLKYFERSQIVMSVWSSTKLLLLIGAVFHSVAASTWVQSPQQEVQKGKKEYCISLKLLKETKSTHRHHR